MGRLGEASATDSILKLLEDNNSNVRIAALGALAALDARSYTHHISRRLNDEHYLVRKAAVLTLSKIGSESDSDSIAKLLLDPSSQVRAMAALALGKILARDHEDGVLILLDDESSWVRECACEALCTIGGRRAQSELAQRLLDPDYSVRNAAARSLCALGSPEGVDGMLSERTHPGHLFLLNAIRSPETWKVLDSKLPDHDLSDSIERLLITLGNEAGLDTRITEKAISRNREYLSSNTRIHIAHKITFRKAYESLVADRLSFVLDGKTVRILDIQEAIKFWQVWREKAFSPHNRD
jgi:hypothetical protein